MHHEMPDAGHLLDLFQEWTPDAGHAPAHSGEQAGAAVWFPPS